MRATEHDEALALQLVANGGGSHPLRGNPFFDEAAVCFPLENPDQVTVFLRRNGTTLRHFSFSLVPAMTLAPLAAQEPPPRNRDEAQPQGYDRSPMKPRKKVHTICFVCERRLKRFFGNYPNPVCRNCDAEAVNLEGKQPWTECNFDDGENPIYIQGWKCWRRYRFGGWVTMADPECCASLEEFYCRHFTGGSLKLDSRLRKPLRGASMLNAKLLALKDRYNLSRADIHVEGLARGDADLYPSLLALATAAAKPRPSPKQKTLAPQVFGFWYDVFLLFSAAAVRLGKDRAQAYVSPNIVRAVVELLTDVVPIATAQGGDLSFRCTEALANTLIAFHGKDIVELARRRAEDHGRSATRFVKKVLAKVEEVRQERSSNDKTSAINPPAGALARAKALFERNGLYCPVLPPHLGRSLHEVREWCFSTVPIPGKTPYEFGDFVADWSKADDDRALLAHDGHGVNSYALHYYLVHGPLRLFLQLPWGGVYDNPASNREAIRECFTLAEKLATSVDGMMAKESFPMSGHLVVAASGLYGSAWHSPGGSLSESERDPLRTQPADVLREALAWATGAARGPDTDPGPGTA